MTSMAPPSTSLTTHETQGQQHIGSGRGGRRNARSAHNPRPQAESSQRGRRDGRGGPRGSKSGETVQNRRPISNATHETTASIPPPPGLSGGGSFAHRLTEDAKNTGGEARTEGNETEVEAEVCFICASLVVHNSVAPCNHRTCHICALRLRALYKTKACAHCRVRGKSQLLAISIVLTAGCWLGRSGFCHIHRQSHETLRRVPRFRLYEARRHVRCQI